MSNSPKTDALLEMRNLRWDQLQDHARTLERQNAELLAALRIIAGEQQAVDNLMSDKEIAREAIRRAEG